MATQYKRSCSMPTLTTSSNLETNPMPNVIMTATATVNMVITIDDDGQHVIWINLQDGDECVPVAVAPLTFRAVSNFNALLDSSDSYPYIDRAGREGDAIIAMLMSLAYGAGGEYSIISGDGHTQDEERIIIPTQLDTISFSERAVEQASNLNHTLTD